MIYITIVRKAIERFHRTIEHSHIYYEFYAKLWRIYESRSRLPVILNAVVANKHACFFIVYGKRKRSDATFIHFPFCTKCYYTENNNDETWYKKKEQKRKRKRYIEISIISEGDWYDALIKIKGKCMWSNEKKKKKKQVKLYSCMLKQRRKWHLYTKTKKTRKWDKKKEERSSYNNSNSKRSEIS